MGLSLYESQESQQSNEACFHDSCSHKVLLMRLACSEAVYKNHPLQGSLRGSLAPRLSTGAARSEALYAPNLAPRLFMRLARSRLSSRLILRLSMMLALRFYEDCLLQGLLSTRLAFYKAPLSQEPTPRRLCPEAYAQEPMPRAYAQSLRQR